MNFQNASARAIGDLHWCISFLCQATPLLMWNFRIISFTETIIESKKWWHTKTTMSAKCWWSPRRASTCCSSTSPGITRWSGDPHSSITERIVQVWGQQCQVDMLLHLCLAIRAEKEGNPFRPYERLHICHCICFFFCSIFIGKVISFFRRLFFSLNSQF